MAGKITLYTRDDALWARARGAAGRGSLSEIVQRCLREYLDGPGVEADWQTPLERARRLRDDLDELIQSIEHPRAEPRSRRRVVRRPSR